VPQRRTATLQHRLRTAPDVHRTRTHWPDKGIVAGRLSNMSQMIRTLLRSGRFDPNGISEYNGSRAEGACPERSAGQA
jgi:hypothetical protein